MEIKFHFTFANNLNLRCRANVITEDGELTVKKLIAETYDGYPVSIEDVAVQTAEGEWENLSDMIAAEALNRAATR